MNRLFFALPLFALLVGCQKPTGKWRATVDVPVYAKADEENAIIFTVKKGDFCALGREQVVKAFMYREVSCAEKEGWILFEGGYPFERLE